MKIKPKDVLVTACIVLFIIALFILNKKTHHPLSALAPSALAAPSPHSAESFICGKTGCSSPYPLGTILCINDPAAS